jgi:hypothetical protein
MCYDELDAKWRRERMKDHCHGPDGAAEHRRQPNSAGCFVCGLRNPIGLKIVFEEDHERG